MPKEVKAETGMTGRMVKFRGEKGGISVEYVLIVVILSLVISLIHQQYTTISSWKVGRFLTQVFADTHPAPPQHASQAPTVVAAPTDKGVENQALLSTKEQLVLGGIIVLAVLILAWRIYKP
jgi:hypothetical protein